MAFCTKCGKENSDSAQFCTGCGNPLSVRGLATRLAASVPGGFELKKISGFVPMIVCSLIGFVLYWFPWVSVNMWPYVKSFSGSELTREPIGSMYILIPLYCIIVLVCIALHVKGMITLKHLKIAVFGGFCALLLIPIDSYYQSVQAIKQAEKMFGSGFKHGMEKSLGQGLNDILNYTVWYYIELLALIGNVVSMAIFKPKPDSGEKV